MAIVRLFRKNRDGNKNLISSHKLGDVSILQALEWTSETLKLSPGTLESVAAIDIIGNELAKE